MKNKLKVLFYDIETTYVLARVWRTGKQFISHDQITEQSKFDIISVAWKWAGKSKVHALTWDLKTQDSSKMIEEFTKVVESADLVVGHNGDKFDYKHINTQRFLHGQAPISWPTSEDTLKSFRKYFAFPSNKLDYLCKVLFGEGKNPMAFRDWIDVKEKKCPVALTKMVKYNKKDVLLLEKCFNKIKPFIQPKTRVSLNKEACPSCGSSKSQKYGRVITRSGFFQRYRCFECSHVFKGGKLK